MSFKTKFFMVEIIGESEEERKKNRIPKRLCDIAQEMFPGVSVPRTAFFRFCFQVYLSGDDLDKENYLTVYLWPYYEISIHKRELLNDALRLARAYEEVLRSEGINISYNVREEY